MLKKFFIMLALFFLTANSLSVFAGDQSKFSETVNAIYTEGDLLLKTYQPQDSFSVVDGFSTLYFDYYEGSGMEVAVAALSPSHNIKTESLFTKIIGGADQHRSAMNLQNDWNELKAQLKIDLNLVEKSSGTTFTNSVLQSFTILLREGFEALLIVTALLAYLRREGHTNKSKVIYAGIGIALLGSVFTAFLFSSIFKNAGANREALEGIVMLVAAFVLFYLSYWLFAKRQAERWQTYIKQKVSSALSTGNLLTLGFTAFLAVYREGAETILFYQALMLGNKNQTPAILLGMALASVALIGLYMLMQKASHRIPFRAFFTITAVFLYYMAFYFIGGGILELQAAGWIKTSPIQGFPHIPWLGIFPTWQNISMQALFLLGSLSAWWLYKIRQTNKFL